MQNMKRSRLSEEQIIGIFPEAEGQETVKTVCAKHNMSEAAFYAWRRKYGGMEVRDARKLRSLKDENVRLKSIVADFSVQNQILKEVNSK
jgi:putative transposase